MFRDSASMLMYKQSAAAREGYLRRIQLLYDEVGLGLLWPSSGA